MDWPKAVTKLNHNQNPALTWSIPKTVQASPGKFSKQLDVLHPTKFEQDEHVSFLRKQTNMPRAKIPKFVRANHSSFWKPAIFRKTGKVQLECWPPTKKQPVKQMKDQSANTQALAWQNRPWGRDVVFLKLDGRITILRKANNQNGCLKPGFQGRKRDH